MLKNTGFQQPAGFKAGMIMLVWCLVLLPNTSQAVVEEVPVKPAAPPLQLVDSNGRSHDLEDYPNQVVVVHFWASWCGTCLEEFTALNAMQRLLRGRDISILAINVGEQPDTVNTVLDQYNADFTVLLDSSTQTAAQWYVQGMPTSYIVGADGLVHYVLTGAQEWNHPQVINLLEDVLNRTRVTRKGRPR